MKSRRKKQAAKYSSQLPAAVVLERARSLCNDAWFTVALQHRRLKTTEPEDRVFAFRWWADLQFLIVALRRLRRGADLIASVSSSEILHSSIRDFDRALPDLRKMRNVGEHVDDYAVESEGRHVRDISGQQILAGVWDGQTFNWLESELDADRALDVAERLFAALANAVTVFATETQDIDSGSGRV